MYFQVELVFFLENTVHFMVQDSGTPRSGDKKVVWCLGTWRSGNEKGFDALERGVPAIKKGFGALERRVPAIKKGLMSWNVAFRR